MSAPGRSCVCENGRPLLRATKVSLRGSSFVATNVANKVAGIRRPRQLTHGIAQEMVSPRRFSLSKIGRRFGESSTGNRSVRRQSAGQLSFLITSQTFALNAREIFGAK